MHSIMRNVVFSVTVLVLDWRDRLIDVFELHLLQAQRTSVQVQVQGLRQIRGKPPGVSVPRFTLSAAAQSEPLILRTRPRKRGHLEFAGEVLYPKWRVLAGLPQGWDVVVTRSDESGYDKCEFGGQGQKFAPSQSSLPETAALATAPAQLRGVPYLCPVIYPPVDETLSRAFFYASDSCAVRDD